MKITAVWVRVHNFKKKFCLFFLYISSSSLSDVIEFFFRVKKSHAKENKCIVSYWVYEWRSVIFFVFVLRANFSYKKYSKNLFTQFHTWTIHSNVHIWLIFKKITYTKNDRFFSPDELFKYFKIKTNRLRYKLKI